MVKAKKKKTVHPDDIKIEQKDESSLAEFTQRPIPTEEEVEDFS